MGHHHHHRKTGKTPRSQTLPSSPTHSSSSSDFEFTVSLSPRKSSATNLCPADDLFYKGQLLPLHLSPRISMVRTLLLSSSSTSSSATTARHSSDSHSSFSTDGCCDSSRPSSVTDDDLHLHTKLVNPNSNNASIVANNHKKPNKYFSLSRFSSVFRKETKTSTSKVDPDIMVSGSSVKRMSATAKEMIRKYLKKARPLYEKLSQKSAPSHQSPAETTKTDGARKENDVISHSFSGNLRYPRRRSCVSSCPSSMRSSPSHSGILCHNSVVRGAGGICSSNSSSMEELQSAIQGAIAHCKNSMTQNK
ncbi:putative BKI1/putative membrane-associated kinase regulator/4 [Helianthus annuus]|uniref:BKI1/putative membrane-associated kinase regulator 1/3/4 n=1 Tax=Helianthus annuus TaxID=4232 RepID=A0A251S4T8_HELAN|nr:probable membrane-associated kinase regulator 1 [Helianthus annuus]KAF5810218.1 putative BKI1/putative membrane-associated kinase regulator 1/3/4 [Helianthus annuus]KAJ0581085.1 putative BKI1/putative membrane-associated kinase regulator/4 [Helianthus annuus]KAJ0588915.1 putative BKI1/putative membrane-associated kinase regulator/4 [Helianthus annuus]KAJ0597031.1 putative BKI1/putative membrane-associated kinase regulator/4 [Helianthus annuus]KAJ0757715.1 putative BKI1/putative membrane-ass